MKKISIYGLGNFGYAILKHLDSKDNKDFSLHGYDRNKKLMNHLRRNHKHLYFHKSIKVSKLIRFDKSVKELMENCDMLILAINSDSTREVLRKIKNHINKKLVIVNTAKALDYQTGKRISQVIRKELNRIDYDYALLAGGTIAKDLFSHEPLGIDVACENKQILQKLVQIFQASNLTVYPTTDLIGVEYASAFKNIISILAGIIKGMNFSYGSETHIISRSAHEIEKIVLKNLGGKSKTFGIQSQCWGNDLWMSSTGNTRNREFGILLGQGMAVDEAIRKMKKEEKTIEGLKTIQALGNIRALRNYPLTNFLYEFIVLKKVGLEKLMILISNHEY